MSNLVSTHSSIHRRFKAFVKWIAPDPDIREKIEKQAQEIRDRIKPQAEKDGLIIKAMPLSGSFPKYSGLRRHMRGHSMEEGQDIDIAFIMEPKDKNGKELGCLVDRFEKYAKNSYPDSEVGSTKSSATIKFTSTKQKYDLVPLFEMTKKDMQLLKRTDGKERKTSVVRHVDFVNKRKQSSDSIDGVVRFNECLRLVKWWRTVQQEDSGIFGNDENDDKVPSFLLDLLCAYAYDQRSVSNTYAVTLAMWFGLLANIVRNRKDVMFNPPAGITHEPALWKVLDPVDPTNNVVKNWSNAEINELARWFENARDEINRAIRYDEQGDETALVESLVKLFGTAFKNNSGT